MKALVSIVMPAYNSGKFIAESVRSVIAQTYSDWELLIVDDCSNDDTTNIIRTFTVDDRIKLHVLEKNSGAGIARNTAISMAKGKYIAFLDSDDLWKPMKLEKQLGFMETLHLPFTFSFYDCINEAGKPLDKRIEAPQNLSYRQLFFCNYVGNLTGIYDTDFFGKIEIASVRKRQDWIMWLTILKKIKKAQPVPESLAFYRIRENSVSASKASLLKHNFAVYRNFHKFNSLVSVFCMAGFLFTQLLIKPNYTRKIKA
jgi:glycosyltransferase involved in cell wall biosynthesis